MPPILSALVMLIGCTCCLAQTQPTTRSVTVVGSVEPFWSADLYAKASGYIADVKADLGDRVTKGQILAVIDAPELAKELAAKRAIAKASEASIKQAQTSLEVAKQRALAAQAQEKLAEVTLKRQEELFTQKAATEQEMDEVRSKSDVAKATAGEAQAKIAAAEADLLAAQANSEVARAEAQRLEALFAYTNVIAPFDGVITRRAANPGDLAQVASGNRGAALFTCQQTNQVRVFADVPESSATMVHAGDKTDIQLYGQNGPIVHGDVARLAGTVNPTTRTMRVEIDLPNDKGSLVPGVYAQVTITFAK